MTINGYRIIWRCEATGSDETFFLGNLTGARKSARQMIGEPVTFNGEQIGVVESAFVADDNGDEIPVKRR